MAEVTMLPGAGYVVLETDGEVKQLPGLLYLVEAAAVGQSITAAIGLITATPVAGVFRSVSGTPATIPGEIGISQTIRIGMP